MKSFNELGIEMPEGNFLGNKIEISDVVNTEIVISDFKIEKSKFPEKGNGLRLVLQIIFEEKDRIIFTSSVILQDMIKRVKKEDFPFKAKIIALKPKGFKFT